MYMAHLKFEHFNEIPFKWLNDKFSNLFIFLNSWIPYIYPSFKHEV